MLRFVGSQTVGHDWVTELTDWPFPWKPPKNHPPMVFTPPSYCFLTQIQWLSSIGPALSLVSGELWVTWKVSFNGTGILMSSISHLYKLRPRPVFWEQSAPRNIHSQFVCPARLISSAGVTENWEGALRSQERNCRQVPPPPPYRSLEEDAGPLKWFSWHAL